MTGHSEKAALFVVDDERVHWHDQSLWFVRLKRDKQAASIPEWEMLRDTAAAIKTHTLSRLADYLEEFERNAVANGIQVYWARDGAEHNAIVHKILLDRGVTRLVKSKSMLTEECHLNPYLEARGIEVTDTDLGERIVQLRHEPPSHIVLPAIHLKKEDIGELFHEKLGTKQGASDAKYLTEAARGHLREKFMATQAGLTGVNFAIAETGGIVVCTNEGNADMGTSLPPIHIACMGVEKILPRAEDLGIFQRLLARSATGQPVTTYSSHFHGPIPGGELHVVIVDNGRSAILAQETFRRSLSCIRCGACMNTCPVFRRSGGYSYGYTVPGPIGSLLGPQRDMRKYGSLPFASSLCGSCTDVCPVKIDLHHELYAFRQVLVRKKVVPLYKRFGMAIISFVLARPWLYRLAGKLMRWIVPRLPRTVVYGPWNAWGIHRELPPMPRESFRELLKREPPPSVPGSVRNLELAGVKKEPL
ncbi:MAG TPA: lactate utilization protein B [Candidatus Saccharimonadales bacterium]|nr:lactate utilization protein B [Candidatus Saccharimonadales bacterium]